MKIISSQPFLIVFYRKVLPLFPSEKKQSSAEPAPSGGTFPCERKRTLSLFHHSLFSFLKHPVQKIGESGKYSHHHEKKRIGNHH